MTAPSVYACLVKSVITWCSSHLSSLLKIDQTYRTIVLIFYNHVVFYLAWIPSIRLLRHIPFQMMNIILKTRIWTETFWNAQSKDSSPEDEKKDSNNHERRDGCQGVNEDFYYSLDSEWVNLKVEINQSRCWI